MTESQIPENLNMLMPRSLVHTVDAQLLANWTPQHRMQKQLELHEHC